MDKLFWDWTEGDHKCVSDEGIATLNCVTVIFHNIIMAALMFSGVTAVFFIVFAGIKLITSGGDPKQVAAAQQTMTFAIIGLVLIFLSFFIINFIGYFTGATCISEFGFTNCK